MQFGDPGGSGGTRAEVRINAGMLRDLAPVLGMVFAIAHVEADLFFGNAGSRHGADRFFF